MQLRLKRYHYGNRATLGTLHFEDPRILPLYTLEPPWKNNKRNISCIPAGTYRCTTYSSPKYSQAFWVHDVPGRDAILIHAGNIAAHTKGCILIGMVAARFSTRPMVRYSKNALSFLNKQCLNEPFTLVIEA